MSNQFNLTNEAYANVNLIAKLLLGFPKSGHKLSLFFDLIDSHEHPDSKGIENQRRKRLGDEKVMEYLLSLKK